MNVQLIEQAKARVPCTPVLINMVSKRVRQLIAGQRPCVRPLGPEEDKQDIALREIAEGKLVAEVEFTATGTSE